MICFHFTIFVVLETTTGGELAERTLLWFAFILLSLSYWKQHFEHYQRQTQVVICFHFTIFVVLETTYYDQGNTGDVLWFAFILLSLSYWKQPFDFYIINREGCDLLSFYYLCRTGNNTMFITVLPLELWFAFILLSLSYWKQLSVAFNLAAVCCDLLSFYYLCRTGNNYGTFGDIFQLVVICFHFTIFVVLETTRTVQDNHPAQLWFAFILLSLSYWKQLKPRRIGGQFRCDLLSFYYLCRTGNNSICIIRCMSVHYRDCWNIKNVVSDRT